MFSKQNRKTAVRYISDLRKTKARSEKEVKTEDYIVMKTFVSIDFATPVIAFFNHSEIKTFMNRDLQNYSQILLVLRPSLQFKKGNELCSIACCRKKEKNFYEIMQMFWNVSESSLLGRYWSTDLSKGRGKTRIGFFQFQEIIVLCALMKIERCALRHWRWALLIFKESSMKHSSEKICIVCRKKVRGRLICRQNVVENRN